MTFSLLSYNSNTFGKGIFSLVANSTLLEKTSLTREVKTFLTELQMWPFPSDWCFFCLQVQASVKDIISRSITQTNLKTDLIIYADNAHVVEFTTNNYGKVIDDLKPGGMTNFKAAFTKVNRMVSEAGKH